MKSVFLSVVIICALAIAGVGGTLANFSDTEAVTDSSFTTGDLDLKVFDYSKSQYQDDPPYGSGAFSGIDITCAWPEKPYRGEFWVTNYGCVDGTLYIHLKDFEFFNVTPTHKLPDYRYPWNKPEPELVEEYGGYLDQCEVCAKGVYGDAAGNFSLAHYVYARVYYGGKWVIPWTLLEDLESDWYELGELPGCGIGHKVIIELQYNDIPDEFWTNPRTGCPEGGDPLFMFHKTNGLMTDKIVFDVDFGLVSPPAK